MFLSTLKLPSRRWSSPGIVGPYNTHDAGPGSLFFLIRLLSYLTTTVDLLYRTSWTERLSFLVVRIPLVGNPEASLIHLYQG